MSSRKQEFLSRYIDALGEESEPIEECMEREDVDSVWGLSDSGWGFSSLARGIKKGVQKAGGLALKPVSMATSVVRKLGSIAATPMQIANKAVLRTVHLAAKGLKYTPAYYAAKKMYVAAETIGDKTGMTKAAKKMTHLTSRGLNLMPGYKAASTLAIKGAKWIAKHPVQAIALANVASLGIMAAHGESLAMLGECKQNSEEL